MSNIVAVTIYLIALIASQTAQIGKLGFDCIPSMEW